MPEEMEWGNVAMGDESVSEKDVSDAEAMGQMVWGKFLCTCIESKPREAKLKEYACIGANLKFEIEEVLEIKGEKVDPKSQDAEALEGRFLWDDVLMEHPQEKEGMRKRRILIGKRLGLVKAGEKLTKDGWSFGVMGKRVILTTEENRYEDKKTGAMKTGSPKVTFGGYESVDAPQKGGEDYDDI